MQNVDNVDLFSAQIEASLDGILIVDVNGKIMSFNKQFYQMWGIPESIVATRSDELTLRCAVEKLVDPASFINKVEYLYAHAEETSKDVIGLKDGRFFERYSAPVVVSPNRYYGRIWYFRDITERVNTNRALEESERRFREMTGLLPIAVFETDLAMNITYQNQSASRMLGHDDVDLRNGLNMRDCIAMDDVSRAGEEFKLFVKGGHADTGTEFTALKKDGTKIPVLVNASVITRDGKPAGARGFLLDYSDRKRADEAEELYRVMVENAGDMVSLLDEKARFVFVNANQVTTLGYEQPEDLIGKSALNFIHPLDVQKTINALAKSAMSGKHTLEIRLRHKKGNYIWFDVKGNTVHDKGGKKRVLVMARDVSESKRLKEELLALNQGLEKRVEERTRDLKNAQEKLIRNEKLAAVGKVSSTISHELRNPIGAISNSVYFLKMKLDNAGVDDKVKKHLEMLENNVDRVRQIISEMLDFTRVTKLDVTKCSVVDAINAALGRVVIPNGVTVETFFTNVFVEMDHRLIEQAFLNIITNAIQAMPKGGKLTIAVKENEIYIAFTDTGTGISKENVPSLFEPLFTTKPSGIGLGLTMVKDVVDKHGGRIEVESEVGVGTTFKIILKK
jgi:PAS domain S-box-containing protein